VGGTIVIKGSNGYSATTDTTGNGGRFSIQVPAGTYTVKAQQGIVGCSSTGPIRVAAGNVVKVTLECPVP